VLDLTENVMPFGNNVELLIIAPTMVQVGWKEPLYSRSLGTLIYAESGCGVYYVNDKLYTVNAGECFWIPYDTVAALLPVEGQPFHIQQLRYQIHDPVLYQQLRNVFPPIKVDHSMMLMLTYLRENLSNRDPENRWRVEAFSRAILGLICVELPPSGLRDSSFITTEGYCPATRKLLYHLENHLYHYHENSLSEISQALGYNKNYLSAIFSKETGCSIRDYINFHRARVSVIFFFCWEMEIIEACEWLGFSSYSHFNRIFKRFVGVPPSSFRKACLSLSVEERAAIAREETLLSFRIMPIDDLFASLRHIGQTMTEVLKREAK